MAAKVKVWEIRCNVTIAIFCVCRRSVRKQKRWFFPLVVGSAWDARRAGIKGAVALYIYILVATRIRKGVGYLADGDKRVVTPWLGFFVFAKDSWQGGW